MAARHGTDLYDELAGSWWDESGVLHSLGTLLDPVRVPFVSEVLSSELGPGGHRVLDVGAGGGLLAEALASRGHAVAALDPSLPSLHAGRDHSSVTGRGVGYIAAVGERLPFDDDSFDAVVCMEVLEHVDAPSAVVAEAARVLQPGGVFVYSGPNRTLRAGLVLVLVGQHLLGVVPRGTHRWDRFLRPDEVASSMRASGIEPIRCLGVGLQLRRVPRALGAVAGLLLGRLTHPEAARRIELVAGTGPGFAYQGYGRRR